MAIDPRADLRDRVAEAIAGGLHAPMNPKEKHI